MRKILTLFYVFIGYIIYLIDGPHVALIIYILTIFIPSLIVILLDYKGIAVDLSTYE